MARQRQSNRLVTFSSRPHITTHRPHLQSWQGPDFSIAVIADLHVSAPWTSLGRLNRIVELVNGLDADLVVLAGDFLAGRGMLGRAEPAHQIVKCLTGLRAHLGIFAILGNHDWQDCALAQHTKFERNSIVEAFADTHIKLLRNNAVSLQHGDRAFWLVGFDSQQPTRRDWKNGLHRPDEAFAQVPDGADTILLAHEPDYFAIGDRRAKLQISGHTHGGQLNLFGWRPMTPSRFGSRYAYGHKQDEGRHLIVSGGIGFSGLPMRIGQPPEITLVEIVRPKT
ncbi:MAG: metallophosphoesterase [Marinosulfonomonas sp.]|nr:metallophosphoesterase [Marinosulfonomonas sp.]